METNQLYEFGPYRLDGVRRVLTRDGEPVPMASKVLETLLVLVRNHGRVMGKDDLLKAIWPDSFVEEANLAQNVSTLRKALGEAPGDHRYIATIPGKGYRFVGDVALAGDVETEITRETRTTTEVVVDEEVETDEALRSFYRSPWAVALCVIAAAGLIAAAWLVWRRANENGRAKGATGARSLAVMPFQAINPQSDGALGLGLADAIITKLSNVHQLLVRPTSSIRKYVGSGQDAATIGRELNVDALLQGHVQQIADRIRVTVQLVKSQDGAPLWAETFDESSTNIFAVEDAISEKVSRALAVKLAAREKQRLDRQYTTNLAAYRNYLDGRYAEFKLSRDGLNEAIAYFNRATQIDPSYALAYAGLADAYTTASDWVLSPREALPKAEAAARRALEFDDEMEEAHAALAHAQLHEWKLAEAGKEFARALELNPNNAAVYFGYCEYLAAAGKQDQSYTELRKALVLDPLSAGNLFLLGFPLYLKHDFEGALAADREAMRVYPEFWGPHMAVGYTHLAGNRMEQAIEEFEKARRLNPEATINTSGLAMAYAQSGHRDEALKILAEMQKMSSEHYVAPFDFAVVYEGLGERNRALDWLEKAYADQSEMMLFLPIYPPLAGMKSEPRFRELVRRVGVQPN